MKVRVRTSVHIAVLLAKLGGIGQMMCTARLQRGSQEKRQGSLYPQGLQWRGVRGEEGGISHNCLHKVSPVIFNFLNHLLFTLPGLSRVIFLSVTAV